MVNNRQMTVRTTSRGCRFLNTRWVAGLATWYRPLAAHGRPCSQAWEASACLPSTAAQIRRIRLAGTVQSSYASSELELHGTTCRLQHDCSTGSVRMSDSLQRRECFLCCQSALLAFAGCAVIRD
jgi:hypothetical protein